MKTLTNKWYEEVRQGPSGSEDDDDETELLWRDFGPKTENSNTGVKKNKQTKNGQLCTNVKLF